MPAAPTDVPASKERHPSLILAVVLIAVFVNLLDVSLVNVAIPSIRSA